MDDEERDALVRLWLYGPQLVGRGIVAPYERLEVRGYVRHTGHESSTGLPRYEALSLDEILAVARSEARDDGEGGGNDGTIGNAKVHHGSVSPRNGNDRTQTPNGVRAGRARCG